MLVGTEVTAPSHPGKMFTLHLWTRSVAGCRIPEKLLVVQLTRLRLQCRADFDKIWGGGSRQNLGCAKITLST